MVWSKNKWNYRRGIRKCTVCLVWDQNLYEVSKRRRVVHNRTGNTPGTGSLDRSIAKHVTIREELLNRPHIAIRVREHKLSYLLTYHKVLVLHAHQVCKNCRNGGTGVRISCRSTFNVDDFGVTGACSGQRLSRDCQNGGYQDPNNCNRCLCPDGFGGQFCTDLEPAQGGEDSTTRVFWIEIFLFQLVFSRYVTIRYDRGRAFFNAQWRKKCAVINWKCAVTKGCLCSDKTIYQCMKMFKFKDLQSTMSFMNTVHLLIYVTRILYNYMTAFITQQLL